MGRPALQFRHIDLPDDYAAMGPPYSVAEAAAAMGISKSKCEQLIAEWLRNRTGGLASYTEGRRRLVSRRAVQDRIRTRMLVAGMGHLKGAGT